MGLGRVLLTVALMVASTSAYAGWWARFCEKHFIADDPNQFELASDRWLMDEINRLEMKVDVWAKVLSKREESQLKLLKGERDKRVRIREIVGD